MTGMTVQTGRAVQKGMTGMTVHVAARTDRLADGLAELLATPSPDPFSQELVVVPAKGVERWLTQRLSHRLGVGPRGTDGVCAGVRFVSPRSLVALLTGTERTDPWDPDRLVWSVLASIDASLDQPWSASLARHLGEDRTGEDRDVRRDRRWSVARRLAGLFATYAVQRPRLVADWSRGADTDGAGQTLADDVAWQPHLWRLVAQAVAAGGGVSPQERHRAALEGIRGGRPLALPDRLSLFGHTRLPVTEIELVRAVAEVRQVHLWLPTPSPSLWRRLEPVVAAGPVLRHDDLSVSTVRHPLLSSLGRDTRELRRSLTALGPAELEDAKVDGSPSAFDRPSLLGWLQTDLRTDTEPDAATRGARVLAADDRTVQVHAAHGMARQVEVLREVLVGLLEDDPTLEPRDILVMCPDVDTYAPLFQAAFGLGGTGPLAHRVHPAHRLRLRLADRGLAQTNPFIALATQVIGIAGGRATFSQVLDLASSPPVRHRFGLGDKELATITSWAEQAGVRWGLSGGLRAAYRLEKFPQNTWRAGLDRLLVGVAMSEGESLVGDVLPLDDVPSAEVDLVGRFAELVDRLEAVVEAMEAASGVEEWIRVLRDGVGSLGSTSPRDAWQVAQFERELAAVSSAAVSSAAVPSAAAASAAAADDEASADGPAVEDGDGALLRLADLRALLEQRAGGRPTRANFRTGALTVCTMVPMRSVPHRVVCLVGLDDGVFPRATSLDGDDVLLRNPVTGERDSRSEDRQLLLDAILSATERLVITYTGANEVTGQDRPPAVPLGELLDALDTTATVGTPTTGGIRDRVLVRHPLQPYDARNLTPGALGGTRAFSFDRAALAGASAAGRVVEAVAAGRPPIRAPFLSRPLQERPPTDLALRDLQELFAHPAKAFLRRRLDISVPRDVDEPDDAMPLDLDGLQRWSIGDRMLRRLLDGVTEGVVSDAERRRGELPPGALAEPLIDDVAGKAVALVTGTRALRSVPSRSMDVTVDLGDGRRLTGVVPDVRGEQIVRVHYSTLAPKHRLATWLDLVVLTAAFPATPWSAATVGWSGGRDQCPKAAMVGPLGEGVRDLLADLVDIYDRGMREVVPLPVKTGHAWAEAASRRRAEDYPARQAWETDRNAPVPGEQDDPAHLVVYDGRAPFDKVKGIARRDERWNDASSRLGQYAERLWRPILAHERTVLL